jgi:hypothetical protein
LEKTEGERDALLDLELDNFERAHLDLQLADTLRALMDAVEENTAHIERLEAAAIRGEPANEYGLTDTDRIIGWRFVRVLKGEDPKNLVNAFPPERTPERTPALYPNANGPLSDRFGDEQEL